MSFKVQRWTGSSTPEPLQLRRVLESEGYKVFDWSDAPGTVYKQHSHGEDQSHWIISGALELTVGDKRYTLTAGDRDFMPANTMHSAFVPGSEPVRYLIGTRY